MESQDSLAGLLRTPRIIWVGMVSGALAFGAIAGVLATSNPPAAPESAPIMLLVWAVVAASSAVAYPIVRSAQTRMVKREWDASPGKDDPTGDLFPRWMTQWLIGAALVEGVTLFGIVILLVTGHKLAIAAAALAWLVLAAQVPTESGVRRFVQNVTGQVW